MVCGGAFHSSHLLMVSGIGDAVSLRALGTRVHKHLPGVGKNLQDHLLQPIFFHSRQELPVPQFIAEAGLFVRTRPGMRQPPPICSSISAPGCRRSRRLAWAPISHVCRSSCNR
jgi:choline dehydrogenase